MNVLTKRTSSPPQAAAGRSQARASVRGVKFMRLILLSICMSLLTGCAGVAAVIGCGAESFTDRHPKDPRTYRAAMTVHAGDNVHVDSATIVCDPIESYCGGGSWYTKWAMEPTESPTLAIDLGNGRRIFVEAPNCYGLSHSAGRGEKYYSYWRYPHVVSGGTEAKLLIHSEQKEASLEEHGIGELDLEVALIE